MMQLGNIASSIAKFVLWISVAIAFVAMFAILFGTMDSHGVVIGLIIAAVTLLLIRK